MLARIVECLQNTGESAPPPSSPSSTAGPPCPGEFIEAALLLFPDVGFVNAYGLTETASTIALLSPDDHRRALDDADPAARDRPAQRSRSRAAGSASSRARRWSSGLRRAMVEAVSVSP